MWLFQNCHLKMKPGLLIEVCTVERGPFRIVTHHLVADSIRRGTCRWSLVSKLRRGKM